MKTHTLQVRRAMLVYQAGIANVFKVDCYNLSDYGRNAKRLYQGTFQGALDFALGLATAGAGVKTAVCNKAGDIAKSPWTEDFENAPFADSLVILDKNNTGYTD